MYSAEKLALITQVAESRGIEPAALLAVVEVESAGKAFATIDGRREPLIRFEGHYFDRRLSDEERAIAREAGLSSPTPGAIRNPAAQAARWRLLERAAAINREAAYESTSWGVGQVMGAHWADLGYESVGALVEDARNGLEGQLRLMIRYIERAGLSRALRHHDWTAFARGYNGPGFAKNSYHLRLSLAYRRHVKRMTARGKPGPDHAQGVLKRGDRGKNVRELQRQLGAVGFPVAIDGVFGPETGKAVQRLQRAHGLRPDGIVGPRTLEAIEGSLPASSLMKHLRCWLARVWNWRPWLPAR